MASRAGDMDPAVVLHLQKLLGYTPDQVDTLLNKKSGGLGDPCTASGWI
jgi:acetate kinase